MPARYKNLKYALLSAAVIAFANIPLIHREKAISDNNVLSNSSDSIYTLALSKYPQLANWSRPDSSARVGIQIGHLRPEEHSEETAHLRGNYGTQAAGVTELEVNTAIAQELKSRLLAIGIEVDLLPSLIPPSYWADVFIAIHADGSTDITKSGFKASGSYADLTGKAQRLVDIIKEDYGANTGLNWDPQITSNMRGYYAFSWWKNEHAIHPMTVGVIMETGFLTNPSDRLILLNNSGQISQSLAGSIEKFLIEEKILK